MVPILSRISISAKEYVGHIQIYVVPIFIPLSSRSCGLGITYYDCRGCLNIIVTDKSQFLDHF